MNKNFRGGKCNKMEISNLPDKSSKYCMFNELGGRMDEHCKNFNKEIKNIKVPNRSHRGLKKKKKKPLEDFKSRLNKAEEMSVLKDRAEKLTKSEQQNEKKTNKL